jgi:hypothetical protein
MNCKLAQKIADAVLYEGYLLYPYRRSALKNQQRWTFGTLYPASYSEVLNGTERSCMHSECLLEAHCSCTLNVQVRFLQTETRYTKEARGERTPSPVVAEVPGSGELRDCCIDFHSQVCLSGDQLYEFGFRNGRQVDLSCAEERPTPGDRIDTQGQIRGRLSVRAESVRPDLLKITIDLQNQTQVPSGADRDWALACSLLSANLILSTTQGSFISLLDPPEEHRETAKNCRNIGNFPVLVGAEGDRDMMLCSPIILYDYPQIAPESAGDFYDATEMDEMLTLRIVTMTDQEKDEMQCADEHARNLLQRTEQTAREQLARTHGVIRSIRAMNQE